MENKTYFDGEVSEAVGISILSILISIITAGIGFPWVACMSYRWQINHTVIEGRRLKFSGRPESLFGNWIKWVLLTIITCGIYGFWVPVKLEQWKVENTSFAN